MADAKVMASFSPGGGQAASPAHGRPGQARGALRRALPPHRLGAVEPRQRRGAAVSEARSHARSSPALAEQMLALANGNRGGIDEAVITEMAAVLAPGPFIVAGGV